MKEKLKVLLESTRFWALVIGAVAMYLKTKGYIAEAEMVLINTILGGHIVLNTADKFSKKSTTTTVTMPTGVSEVTATQKKKKQNS